MALRIDKGLSIIALIANLVLKNGVIVDKGTIFYYVFKVPQV